MPIENEDQLKKVVDTLMEAIHGTMMCSTHCWPLKTDISQDQDTSTLHLPSFNIASLRRILTHRHQGSIAYHSIYIRSIPYSTIWCVLNTSRPSATTTNIYGPVSQHCTLMVTTWLELVSFPFQGTVKCINDTSTGTSQTSNNRQQEMVEQQLEKDEKGTE